MNIFEIVGHCYTEKSTKWIDQLTPEELKECHPIVLNKFFSMNPYLTFQLPILNDYAIILDTKKFLFVAWAVLPKYDRLPFFKYIKKEVVDDEFDFVWDKFKNFTEIKGNDFKSAKKYLEADLQKNMKAWFFALGIDKKYWKKYKLDYHEPKVEKKPVGLGAWF